MPPENNAILLSGTELFGYRVLEFVGEGGWSYVYKAQHPELPLFVAIKQLKPDVVGHGRALQRFVREADIVARLNHPNVVTIYGLKHDEKAGRHYIITEFAEKGSLADRLDQFPEGLPVDEILDMAMGICSGLAAVHDRGVIHRDIKPGNILLFDVGGGRDIPKLCDFGIAEAPVTEDVDVGVDLSDGTGVYGTLCYMSPEQLDKKVEVDHRSDLYSLGIVLYELLTGHVPFTGEVKDVFWAHTYLSPKPPRDLRPDVPEELERVVLRALCKDCQGRYQSAADMLDALRAIEDIHVRRNRQQRFRALLQAGFGYLEKEEWADAIEVLRQADILEPENVQVQERLRKAREQQEMKRLYDRGVHCLEEGDWEEAHEYLVRVMGYDPGYAGGQAREQLEQATQELERRQRQRVLMTRYRTGVGHFRQRDWGRAIVEFEWVIAQDSDFEDAADRLADAKRYAHAESLFEQAEGLMGRGKWKEAIDLFEDVKRLNPPHIDVSEDLGFARRKWAEFERSERLSAWYAEGIAQLERGSLEQARLSFERIQERQPGFRDVAQRLRGIQRESHLKRLFERASEHEAAGEWEGATGIYREILGIDPHNGRAADRLARALRHTGRGGRRGLGDWWRERSIGMKVGMVVFGIVVFVLLAMGSGVIPLPSTTGVICNGDFERKFVRFRCWEHGGELDQAVQCDEDGCYALLGSPDYLCNGGVPVGEAWMKQTVIVPQVAGPELSLRYRVFSQDLDLLEYDYFQITIDGKPLSQRYGNHEWMEPSCDQEAWDSGWQALTIDLSDYRGKEVEIAFHNINGTQPYFNTWTYVDDVMIVEDKE